MPNVYKPGLLQIRAQYTREVDSGDTPENVFWFQSGSTATPTLSQLQAIQAVFDSSWAGFWKETGSTDAFMTGSIATDWSSASGLENSSVGTFGAINGVAGAGVPPNVAALISYLIQLRWRGGHFRTYLPYIGSSAIISGTHDQLSPSVIATLQTGFNTFLNDMLASGDLGGQAFRCYKDKTNATLATLYPIAGYTINTVLASQRRRLRRVGRA